MSALKIFGVLATFAAANAASVTSVATAVKASVEQVIAKRGALAGAFPEGRRQLNTVSGMCDSSATGLDAFEYVFAVAIYGADLLKCLCDNNLLETDANGELVEKSTSDYCKCSEQMKASTTFKANTGMDNAGIDNECSDKDDPCFGRDTFAIAPSGETIPMAALKSGDLVMDGPNSVARVIVNQHRETTFKSSLLEISHADGELELTPDHVLSVDGEFVPARLAKAGSKLGESEVSRVTTKAGEVINPLTTSGKILTQGGVLATTYPEWVAEYMLSSYLVPLPVSLSNLISYLFPETTQAYYDAVIEPLVTKAHPKHLAALPAVLPVAFLVGDLAISAGFVGFALASPLALAAIAVVALAKRK